MKQDSYVSRQRLLLRLITSPSIITFLGIVLVAVLLTRWVASVGGPAAIRQSFGWVAPLVTIPIHVLVAITPFPSDVLCVAHGALYGFWLGIAMNWLGWWIAALVEFGLGRRARKDFDLEIYISRLPRWLQRFAVGHPLFLIASRQVPWLGGHVSTLVPGAMGISPYRFLWCSAVAIVPAAVLTAALGAGLLQLSGYE